jgi:hypothetical protein
MLFGIGGTITGIAREWDHHYRDPWSKKTVIHETEEGRVETVLQGSTVRCVNDEGRVALVAGLATCSITFLALLFITGRKRRPVKPFVLGASLGADARSGRDGSQGPDAADSSGAVGVGPPRTDLADCGAVRPSGGAISAPAPSVGASSGLTPHRGVTVLVLGVLGINLFPLGIAAWVMGHHDLIEMDAGRMDPSGRGLTSAGRVCGIVSVLLAGIGTIVGLTVAAASMQGLL